jgi:hypothetical protein
MRKAIRALTVLLAVAAITVVIAPMASAASYTYSNSNASERQVRYSGVRSSIAGGVAYTGTFGPEGAKPIITIETYRPAPGYQSIGYATGGGYVSMWHTSAGNAYQKCFWDWPWSTSSIGVLKLTCSTR